MRCTIERVTIGLERTNFHGRVGPSFIEGRSWLAEVSVRSGLAFGCGLLGVCVGSGHAEPEFLCLRKLAPHCFGMDFGVHRLEFCGQTAKNSRVISLPMRRSPLFGSSGVLVWSNRSFVKSSTCSKFTSAKLWGGPFLPTLPGND